MKIHRRFFSLSVLLSLAMLLNALAGCTPRPAAPANTLEPLTTWVLKIGKADAIVLLSGEDCMVIDAGEEDDGEEICQFLTNLNVPSVGTLIITHFDKDHVGGADTLLERFPVKRVLVPEYEGITPDYIEFLSALETANITPERLAAKQTVEFALGTANVLVEAPPSYPDVTAGVEIDNDCSLIATVTHGNNRLLFMGDAEKTLIRDWLSHGNVQKCDFLKVPHHGVYTTALTELLGATRPSYAAICCSDKNPSEVKTLETLKSYGTDIFETRFGRITVISDGVALEVKQKTN